MIILHNDNKIGVTAKVKPGQRLIRISNGDEVVYMPIGISGGGGDGMSFYRCSAYDNGETIPAHANIVISGITSPVDANGTYILQDPTAESTDRKWVNDGGYGIECSGGVWYIYNTMTQPSVITSLFYADALPSTTGDGTDENPVYWDDALNGSDDRYITPAFNTGDYSGSGYKRNFYVKLQAGTPYQIGVTRLNDIDYDVILYDITGTLIVSGDENSADINGVSCADSVTYTPSVTGIYRIAAGAFSSAVGNTQVVCYPAPEYAEAPTATEPWEIEWKLGGAKEGAYLITAAGYADAIGEYTPSKETFDADTVWTNTTTGAVWKVSEKSGNNVRWFMYANASSSSPIYYDSGYHNAPTPWDIPVAYLSYGQSHYLPIPTFARGAGQAEGTLAVTHQDIAERPATGVKAWSGYKATQNAENGKWAISDTETTGLLVKGNTPIVGRIYSADTTVQVLGFTEDVPGQMVCLAHFDNGRTFTDGTSTCIIQVMGQADIKTDIVKFGTGSWWGNFRSVPWEGGFNIIGLPAVSGDFTVEFWHYYSGYTTHGGLILYVHQNGDMVGELNAIQLSENHPQYIKNAWYHHAFVRQGSTVSEYINGVKVNESEFTATLGGDYSLAVYGGGWSRSDVRNNIDEFAIFNYAKYTKNFTPPLFPYDDNPSGLYVPDTTVREVTVSGITGIPFANSSSYYLTNPNYNTSYPYSRVWSTTDGKWFITFNDMDGGWSVASAMYYDDANYIRAAYIDMDSEAQYYIDPIGHSSWVDAITGKKIKVFAN